MFQAPLRTLLNAPTPLNSEKCRGSQTRRSDRFQKFAKRDKHFESVTKVVPVLSGRHWTTDTTMKAASAANQWRVHQSAAGYDVVRVPQTGQKSDGGGEKGEQGKPNGKNN